MLRFAERERVRRLWPQRMGLVCCELKPFRELRRRQVESLLKINLAYRSGYSRIVGRVGSCCCPACSGSSRSFRSCSPTKPLGGQYSGTAPPMPSQTWRSKSSHGPTMSRDSWSNTCAGFGFVEVMVGSPVDTFGGASGEQSAARLARPMDLLVSVPRLPESFESVSGWRAVELEPAASTVIRYAAPIRLMLRKLCNPS